MTPEQKEAADRAFDLLPGTMPDAWASADISFVEGEQAMANAIRLLRKRLFEVYECTHFRLTKEGNILQMDGWKTRPAKEAPFSLQRKP